MTKTQVIKTVNELPAQFELDELIERLILIDKVERGLTQAQENKSISKEALKAKLAEWKNNLKIT